MTDIIITEAPGPLTGARTGIPHLAFPFQVVRQGNRIGVKTVQQDSIEEIATAVYAALATEPGSREELPDYGMADPTFEGVDLAELRDVLATWEPRADELTDDTLTDLLEEVTVSL